MQNVAQNIFLEVQLAGGLHARNLTSVAPEAWRQRQKRQSLRCKLSGRSSCPLENMPRRLHLVVRSQRLEKASLETSRATFKATATAAHDANHRVGRTPKTAGSEPKADKGIASSIQRTYPRSRILQAASFDHWMCACLFDRWQRCLTSSL